MNEAKSIPYSVDKRAYVAMRQRTEPMSVDIRRWAKDACENDVFVFRGIDDDIWYGVKRETEVNIYRTDWRWTGIQNACDQIDTIINLRHNGDRVTSITL